MPLLLAAPTALAHGDHAQVLSAWHGLAHLGTTEVLIALGLGPVAGLAVKRIRRSR